MHRLRFAHSGLILHLGPRLILTFVLSLTGLARAQDEDFESSRVAEAAGDGTVEIIYPASSMDPYRERRSDWGVQFGANYENFMPLNFVSSNDSNSYSALFGRNPMAIIQANLGLKYNFALGAMTFDLIGGSGSISDARSGVPRTLSITKRAAAIGYTMDAIMQEPYVAPYVQVQVFDFMYQDKGSTNGNSSGVTAWTTGFTVGALIQLNSLDPTDVAVVANSDYGLNNTYLDVFATQYNTSNAKDDPQFITGLNWGAGIRLEF